MTNNATTMTFTKMPAPDWLLAFWKEIDDKTFGKGFDCFAEDATCNLGVADWRGRETIRNNLRAFIDTGFTALHDVTEYWDGGLLKVFRGIVTMTPDDKSRKPVKPVMTHFFYMDDVNPAKVRHWIGSVGPSLFEPWHSPCAGSGQSPPKTKRCESSSRTAFFFLVRSTARGGPSAIKD